MINQMLLVMEPYSPSLCECICTKSQPRKAKDAHKDWGLPQSSDTGRPLALETRKSHLGLLRPGMALRAPPQLLRPPQPLHFPRSAPGEMTALLEAGGLEPLLSSAHIENLSQQRHPVSLSRGIRAAGTALLLLKPRGRQGGKIFRSRQNLKVAIGWILSHAGAEGEHTTCHGCACVVGSVITQHRGLHWRENMS